MGPVVGWLGRWSEGVRSRRAPTRVPQSFYERAGSF